MSGFPECCPACQSRWETPDGFSRIIGVYSMEQDRTVEWLCPDCGTRWDRNALPRAESS